MGPKISSRTMVISGLVSTQTVGLTKYLLSKPSTRPRPPTGTVVPLGNAFLNRHLDSIKLVLVDYRLHESLAIGETGWASLIAPFTSSIRSSWSALHIEGTCINDTVLRRYVVPPL